MAAKEGFRHINFTRLLDVLCLGPSDNLTEDEYVSKADFCRITMESRFLKPDFDLNGQVTAERDTSLTYLGYMRSTREDLRWGPDIDPKIKSDPELYETEAQKVARGMTRRLLVSKHRPFH